MMEKEESISTGRPTTPEAEPFICPECDSLDTYRRGAGCFCKACQHVWLNGADAYNGEEVPTHVAGAYLDVGVRCGQCHRMIGLDELYNQSHHSENTNCTHCGWEFTNWASLSKIGAEVYIGSRSNPDNLNLGD